MRRYPLRAACAAASVIWAAGCGRLSYERSGDSGPPRMDGSGTPDTDAGPAICPAPTAVCGGSCVLDDIAGTWSCTGVGATLLGPGPSALVNIDMTGYTHMVLDVVSCDPTGFVWHVADSPSCDGFGGDAGQFGNDAEVYQLNTAIEAYGSQDVMPATRMFSDPAFAAATGCTLRTVTIEDGEVDVLSIGLDAPSPALLRINPATDSEGLPDALWYLATSRTYRDASRSGTGFRCMTVCLR